MSYFDTIKTPQSTTKVSSKKPSSYFSTIKLPPAGYVPPPAPTYDKNGKTILVGTLIPGAKLFPDNYIPVNSTKAKLPLINKSIDFKDNSMLSDLAKSAIELPEKVVRTFTEALGISKANSDTRPKANVVASYGENSRKYTEQFLNENPGATSASIVLGSAKAFGDFANDALLYADPLARAAKSTALEEKLFKNVIETNKMTKTVYFDGRQVQQAISGGSLAPAESADIVKVIGGDGVKIKNAFKNGITIEIPSEKIVTLQNKPYWEKIRKFFGKAPGEETIVSKFGGEAKETVRGLLPEGKSTATTPTYFDSIKVPSVTPIETKVGITTPTTSNIISETKPEIVKVPGEQLPVGTGETQVSRLEARMKEQLSSITADEAKTAGISTYEQMVKPDQMRAASEYVTSNPTEALDVVMGKIPAPKGLLNNSIALALESQADLLGNADLVAKLSSLRSTRLGQEISILTEADPLSATNVSRQIQISREKDIIKKTGKTPSKAKADITKEIDTIIKEERTLAQIKVAEAEKLLDSLIC